MHAFIRRPIRLLSMLVLSLGLGGAALAQDAATCPPTAKPITDMAEAQSLMAVAKDRGLMFKVTKGDVTHYLYGTMHVGKREWVMPGARMLTALGATRQLALELNLTDPAVLKTLMDPKAYFVSWDDMPKPLKDTLTAQLKASCAPEATFQQPPALAAMRLSMLPLLHQSFHPEFGSEIVLLQTSLQMRRPILGLEEPKDQLDAIQGDNRDEALESLGELTRPEMLARSAKATDTLVKSWENGDLATLENYAKWCDCVNTPRERKAMERLLDTRNVKMAEAIDTRLSRGPATLIGVGALHMIGPKGLPMLLKAKGYTVELLPAISKP